MRFVALALWVLGSLGAGVLGSVATSSGLREWYGTLAKPAWNPPNWLFGPVWTTLYVMMGVAAWVVWSGPPSQARTFALGIFVTQLLVNTAWSFLFFGMRSTGMGLAGILVLDVAVAVTILAFFRLSTAGGLLLLPYMGWILFATVLNLEIYRLNR